MIKKFLADLNEWGLLIASIATGFVAVWKLLPKMGRATGIIIRFFKALAELPDRLTAFENRALSGLRRLEDGQLNMIQNRRLLLDGDLVNMHIECDIRGNLTWANRKWTLITGLSIEESLNRGWELAINPEELESVSRAWQSATDHQRAFIYEIGYINREGKITECRCVATPIKNVDKAIAYYSAVATPLHAENSSRPLPAL